VPGAAHCVGDWNEWYVAATLWDLIDSHDDGLDHVNLTASVIPLTVYLWLGPKISLRFFIGDHMAFTPPQPVQLTVDAYKNNHVP
jgi:hypothetical protein